MAISEDSDFGEVRDIGSFLRGAVTGLYTHQVYRRFVELPAQVSRNTVAQQLLNDQQVGLLDFRARRWKPADRTPEQLLRDEAVVRAIRHRFLDAISADVLPGAPVKEDTSEAPTTDEVTGGWPLLRKLLPYYQECLRLSGASRLSQHVERHKQQFVLIRPRGRWWPDEAGARFLRISRKELTAEFLDGLHRRQSDPLLIG